MAQSPKRDLAGQVFGRWTVLDTYEKTKKGEKKWLCRCSCGTERHVLERTLKSGGSLSCGCLRREAVAQATAYDLTGKIFGELEVLGKAPEQPGRAGIWWQCRCSCGEICTYPATLLVTGRRVHCGGKRHEKGYAHADITGQRFGRLTALSPTKERDSKGFVMWHCRCDCGTELDVSYNALMYTNQCSCGCQKKAHDEALSQLQTRVDGTSLDIIKSSKLPANNTTGVRGVYFVKGKYAAKLVFQKKAYYLGVYPTLEEAAEARKEAEEALYGPTLEYYAQYAQYAAQNPKWAEENPVRIFVKKSDFGLSVSFLPVLERTSLPAPQFNEAV